MATVEARLAGATATITGTPEEIEDLLRRLSPVVSREINVANRNTLILRLLKGGEGVRATGVLLGVSPATVSRVAKLHGLHIPRGARPTVTG